MDEALETATTEQLQDEPLCIVCREAMTMDQNVKVLPCGHIFHLHCLQHWIRHQAHCPMCRSALNETALRAAAAARQRRALQAIPGADANNAAIVANNNNGANGVPNGVPGGVPGVPNAVAGVNPGVNPAAVVPAVPAAAAINGQQRPPLHPNQSQSQSQPTQRGAPTPSPPELSGGRSIMHPRTPTPPLPGTTNSNQTNNNRRTTVATPRRGTGLPMTPENLASFQKWRAEQNNSNRTSTPMLSPITQGPPPMTHPSFNPANVMGTSQPFSPMRPQQNGININNMNNNNNINNMNNMNTMNTMNMNMGRMMSPMNSMNPMNPMNPMNMMMPGMSNMQNSMSNGMMGSPFAMGSPMNRMGGMGSVGGMGGMGGNGMVPPSSPFHNQNLNNSNVGSPFSQTTPKQQLQVVDAQIKYLETMLGQLTGEDTSISSNENNSDDAYPEPRTPSSRTHVHVRRSGSIVIGGNNSTTDGTNIKNTNTRPMATTATATRIVKAEEETKEERHSEVPTQDEIDMTTLNGQQTVRNHETERERISSVSITEFVIPTAPMEEEVAANGEEDDGEQDTGLYRGESKNGMSTVEGRHTKEDEDDINVALNALTQSMEALDKVDSLSPLQKGMTSNDEEDDSNNTGTIEPVALMPIPVVEENENVYREEVVLSPQLRRRAAAAAAAERRLNLKRTTSAEVEVEDSLEL